MRHDIRLVQIIGADAEVSEFRAKADEFYAGFVELDAGVIGSGVKVVEFVPESSGLAPESPTSSGSLARGLSKSVTGIPKSPRKEW